MKSLAWFKRNIEYDPAVIAHFRNHNNIKFGIHNKHGDIYRSINDILDLTNIVEDRLKQVKDDIIRTRDGKRTH